MKLFQQILVACDLSKFTPQVLDYAVALAQKTGARMILANIINPRDTDAIAHAIHKTLLVQKDATPDAFIHQHKLEREARLKRLIDESGRPGLFVKTIVRTGEPFQELINITELEHTELVVMGTRGRSNLQSVLLGATAEKMFRYCPVPLLSVRLEKTRRHP
jgi:nucleotide-binding universal stress UspA family protein